jgi:hypothetical protein
LPQLKARFGFRCLAAPDYQQGLARTLGAHSRQLLAEWSKRNPQENVLGMATIVESQASMISASAPYGRRRG